MNPVSLAFASLGKCLPCPVRQRMNEAATDLAKRCRPLVAEEVGQKAARMTYAEIRGYIRAYSAGITARFVNEVASEHRLGLRRQAAVVESAIEQLVGMVARDVLNARPMPAKQALAA